MANSLSSVLETVRLALPTGAPPLPITFGLFLIASLLTYGIYNIYFHPLSRLSGPKIAAVSNVWTYYYEIRGILTEKGLDLQKKHKSDILRIGPNKVIIHDPAQYDHIYHMGSKFFKDPEFYCSFPSQFPGHTVVTMTDKHEHSVRRKLVMHRMSKQSIENLYDLVAGKLHILLSIFDASVKNGQPVSIYTGWRSMTLDIISTFAFGRCLNCMDKDNDLGQRTLKLMEGVAEYFYLMMRTPGLVATIESPLRNLMGETLKENGRFLQWVMDCVDKYDRSDKTYLFGSLMNTPEGVRNLRRQELGAEGQELIVAGSDTTATTLTYASVHLAREPALWEKLYEEILPIFSDKNVLPSLRDLEGCPLLTACIKEALRLATPVPSYLWRVVPEKGWNIQTPMTTQYLPPGTVVGMTALTLHNDPSLFPNPAKYDPYRWLNAEGRSLDTYLVPFSKGSRQCAGINLAWLEMYLSLSATVRRYKIKGEAEPGKVLYQKDFFVGALQDDKWNILFEKREK